MHDLPQNYAFLFSTRLWLQMKFKRRTYTYSHTPTVLQGRWWWNLPWVFYLLQYFETILPSVESLWPWIMRSCLALVYDCKWNLNLGRTPTVIPPPWYKGGGDGPHPPPPPLGCFICCNISKRFCLQWKACDLLHKMRYILGWWRCWRSVTSPNMVAILVAILDFIKN